MPSMLICLAPTKPMVRPRSATSQRARKHEGSGMESSCRIHHQRAAASSGELSRSWWIAAPRLAAPGVGTLRTSRVPGVLRVASAEQSRRRM